MSIGATNWARTVKVGAPASLKLVLLTLATYANDHWAAWPSRKRLAADTELSDDSIKRAVHALEDRGLLQVIPWQATTGADAGSGYLLSGWKDAGQPQPAIDVAFADRPKGESRSRPEWWNGAGREGGVHAPLEGGVRAPLQGGTSAPPNRKEKIERKLIDTKNVASGDATSDGAVRTKVPRNNKTVAKTEIEIATEKFVNSLPGCSDDEIEDLLLQSRESSRSKVAKSAYHKALNGATESSLNPDELRQARERALRMIAGWSRDKEDPSFLDGWDEISNPGRTPVLVGEGFPF
ncbi:MAG TPA: helix-turn-helix domain-containing protein [Actinocrinis sp.]|uniref:helix-turn-helix domain-containing protein n=1 Tax=Actinocrinis sp. TaxID=1920516 RepID=UPI002DDCBF29|nr:helix-turn-helix domain-containing protein [Actinocrinis sp.]HEV2344341.1 helix-turn-helix domain-containing protein [Actinocrinis sp.]